MAVSLRSYVPQDFETLYRLDQSCFPRGVAYSRAVLRHYLNQPGAACMVAVEETEVAGFILGITGRGQGHIITLDVAETRRRQGIGSLLLRTLEQHLSQHGAQFIELETATADQSGVAFWRHHGYVAYAEAKDYYGRGRDALLMRKTAGNPKEKSSPMSSKTNAVRA